MKKIFSIVILLGLVAGCQSTSNDRNSYGLKGDIHSIKDSYYEVEEKFGEVHRTELSVVQIMKFDPDGHIVEDALYYNDGERMSMKVYEYENDRCVSFREQNKYGNDVEEVFVDIIDDAEVRRRTEQGEEGTKEYTIRIESSKDKLYTKRITTGSDGVIRNEVEEWRDKATHNVKEIKITSGDTVEYWGKRIYDADNRFIEENFTYLSKYTGETQSQRMFKYPQTDQTGNWTEQIYFEDKEPRYMVVREIEYRK